MPSASAQLPQFASAAPVSTSAAPAPSLLPACSPPASPVQPVPSSPAPAPRPEERRQVASPGLSAEHAKLLSPQPEDDRNLSVPELHALMNLQDKDASWAPAKEQRIRQELSAANVAPEFEIMNVDCRSSICEVLAFGNLPEAGEDWNKLMASKAGAGLRDHMKSYSTSSAQVGNGRFAFATIVQYDKRP
jgi:hypothetical protein